MLLKLIRIEFFIPSLGHNIISSRCLCYPIFQQFFCKSCGKISKLKWGKHISLLSKMKHTKPLTLYQIVPGTFHNLQILKYHHRESKLCTESSTSECWLVSWAESLVNSWLHTASYVKFMPQQNHKLFPAMCNYEGIFSLIMREQNQKF